MFTSIQRLLKSGAKKVRLSETWGSIYGETSIGVKQGRYLYFTSQNRRALREWAKMNSGADPLTTSLDGDRMEMAAKVYNEKWASKPVKEGMIEVYRPVPIPLCDGGEVSVPGGAFLTIHKDSIDYSKVPHIIVSENLEPVLKWADVSLSEHLTDALVIYRGDKGTSERAVKVLVESDIPSTKIGWFDFDPAGFTIAESFKGLDTLLLPDLAEVERTINVSRYREHYIAQPKKVSYNGSLPSSLLEWMDTNRCALTQELIISKAIRLVRGDDKDDEDNDDQ